MDRVDKIIAFESGELGSEETLELFSELIADGSVWLLQGCYGRIANDLIERELLSDEGDINYELLATLLNQN